MSDPEFWVPLGVGTLVANGDPVVDKLMESTDVGSLP